MTNSNTSPHRGLALAATCALVLAACQGSATTTTAPTTASPAPATAEPAPSEPLEGPLVVHSRGGTIGDAERQLIWDPFTAETGVEVIQQEVVDIAPAVKTQVETGNVELDLVLITDNGYGLLADCCLSPIDYSRIGGGAARVIESMPEGLAREHAVATTTIGFNLAFDKRKFPDGGPQPSTWADFWDVGTFPGPRAIFGLPFYLVEVALLADGVEPDSLYPLDVERAFRKLEQIKPDVVQLWTQGAQAPQLLTDGEAAVVMGYNGRFDGAIDEGAPIGYSWEGALTYNDFTAIPRGAPHADAAHAAIEFMLRPEVAAAIGEITRYPAPSSLVWDAAPADKRATWPNAPDILPKLVEYRGSWWAEAAFDGSGRTNQEWLTERLTGLFGS